MAKREGRSANQLIIRHFLTACPPVGWACMLLSNFSVQCIIVIALRLLDSVD